MNDDEMKLINEYKTTGAFISELYIRQLMASTDPVDAINIKKKFDDVWNQVSGMARVMVANSHYKVRLEFTDTTIFTKEKVNVVAKKAMEAHYRVLKGDNAE